MSLNLKNTVNNTDLEKENLKQAKNKINNKLIEFGGQAATNLNNIPEELNKIISQYSKVAIGQRACKPNESGTYLELPYSKIVNVNADFKIKRIIGIIGLGGTSNFFSYTHDASYMGIDSNLHYSAAKVRTNNAFGSAYIDQLSNSFRITFTNTTMSNPYFIHWIALG